MRLFTRHSLVRAFPELDRYGEAQRERFFQSAKGSLRRRIARWIGVAFAYVASLACFNGLIIGIAWLHAPNHDFDRFDPKGITAAGYLLAIMLALMLPCFVALLTRDVLLHRRVRHVLRDRGRCTGCGYVLVGLMVSEGNRVTCPECAVVTEVDPSLGDLVIADEGGSRYEPSALGVPPPRFFTSRREKFLKRAVLVTAIGLPVLIVGWIGVREALLQLQSARARERKPGIDVLAAHVESAQPVKASHDEPEAFDVFSRLALQRASIESNFVKSRKPQLDPDPKLDFDPSLLFYKPRADAGADELDQLRRGQVLARALMEDYAASPTLYTMMDELASCRRCGMPINLQPNQPAVNVLMPELGQMRQLARVNAARMTLAQEKGDMQEWLRAFEANLALARMGLSQFTLIQGLVGVAIEALTHARLRELLRDHPSDDVLHAIEQAMVRQRAPDLLHSLEGERVMVRDTLAWYFSDPKRTRWGRFSRDASALFGCGNDLRKGLGWLNQNLRECDRMFDAGKGCFELTPARQRESSMSFQGFESDLLLISMFQSSYSLSAVASWRLETDRRAVQVLIALERCRNSKGEYPSSLQALTPEHLATMPLDPYSDRPFGYILFDAPDSQGRCFILYSVGVDGDDDAGAIIHGRRYGMLDFHATHFIDGDFVLNEFDE